MKALLLGDKWLVTKRTIQQKHLVDNSSFEYGVHTKSSEPYFAEVIQLILE